MIPHRKNQKRAETAGLSKSKKSKKGKRVHKHLQSLSARSPPGLRERKGDLIQLGATVRSEKRGSSSVKKESKEKPRYYRKQSSEKVERGSSSHCMRWVATLQVVRKKNFSE